MVARVLHGLLSARTQRGRTRVVPPTQADSGPRVESQTVSRLRSLTCSPTYLLAY